MIDLHTVEIFLLLRAKECACDCTDLHTVEIFLLLRADKQLAMLQIYTQ